MFMIIVHLWQSWLGNDTPVIFVVVILYVHNYKRKKHYIGRTCT